MASTAYYGFGYASTVWNSWITASSDSTTHTSGSGGPVWATWNQDITGDRTISPEEVQAYYLDRAQFEAEHLRQQAELEKKESEAKQRARDLLDLFLSPEQQKTMNEIGSILVQAENQKWFRINRKYSSNIDELDDKGKVIAKLCIVPKESVPLEDQMLTQKLMLETNIADVMKIAHRFPVTN